MEEVKMREIRINELQKKIGEWEAKLKQQQQLYESVRSDRNLYSKNLIESQDEIAEMKRKFKIMNHQIEQLKEEISAKDSALVKEHFDHQKVQKQREQQRNEISRMKRLLGQNDDIIHKQDAEIRRLASMIRRMDEEALTQRKEYDQVINERDILGTQLIRRNDELALLYEKLKIQQSTLRKGEAQYSARVEDIRLLKLKIKDLQREAVIAKGNVVNVDGVRRELMHKNKELLQEKTKVKALSEELENPMNVHRWRKLEGSDPATYEMIQKIQTLQQRLIKKTEEVVEKDMLLQEKERLYLELKKILARQPGPEVAEQLSFYQSSLKEKTRQMKAMASELNMYQAQVNEYKYEIERLTRELQDVKRKFYEAKRREALAREMEEEENIAGRQMAKSQAQKAQQATTRFTGGGFAIK
jgi:chromosome segregation ATPase